MRKLLYVALVFTILSISSAQPSKPDIVKEKQPESLLEKQIEYTSI
jgi:hypothetical protein